MLTARKYRLYPTPEQEEWLKKHFGCVRYVYNQCLETKLRVYQESGRSLGRFEPQGVIREMKTEHPWLKDVNSQSLQVCALHLSRAFKNFQEGRAQFPRFKSRRNRQTFLCPQYVGVSEGKLLLPKFRSGIPVRLLRPLGGTIRHATVSQDPLGKYDASLTIETGAAVPPPREVKVSTAVGIDVGIKSFMVFSDGTRYDNPRYLEKSLKRLKVLQRRLSRKQRGGRNRAKAQKRVALQREKITNQRKDFLHGECSWKSCSTRQSGGGRLLQCGRFDPTSKRHHECGYLYRELKLSEREWICPGCGALVGRDENAALNILYYVLMKYFLTHGGVERTGEPVELSGISGSEETGRFRERA